MTNNEIYEHLEKNHFIEELCISIAKGSPLTRDLIQEVSIMILLQDNDKLNKALEEKWLKYLVISIIRNQFNSKSSKFYKIFKKFNYEHRDNIVELSILDDTSNEEFKNTSQLNRYIESVNNGDEQNNINIQRIDDIESIIETELTWYDKTLFKMYHKLGEYNAVDGEYRIMWHTKPKMSYRDIEKETDINYISVGYSINKSKKIIQEKLGI